MDINEQELEDEFFQDLEKSKQTVKFSMTFKHLYKKPTFVGLEIIEDKTDTEIPESDAGIVEIKKKDKIENLYNKSKTKKLF